VGYFILLRGFERHSQVWLWPPEAPKGWSDKFHFQFVGQVESLSPPKQRTCHMAGPLLWDRTFVLNITAETVCRRLPCGASVYLNAFVLGMSRNYCKTQHEYHIQPRRL